MKLKTLKNKFPIHTDRFMISVLGYSNINSYAMEIVKEYFVEHMDNRSVLKLTQAEIRSKLKRLIDTYDSNNELIYEFRLIIKDRETLKVLGGITLTPKKNIKDELDIAYWIKPEHQGKGIATESVNKIIKFIGSNIRNIKRINLEVQEVNSRSIALAERCNFKKRCITTGIYCNNIKYCLELGGEHNV